MNQPPAKEIFAGRSFLRGVLCAVGFALAIALLSPHVLPLHGRSERFHAWVLLMGVAALWIRRRAILWRIALPAGATLLVVLGYAFHEAAQLNARQCGSTALVSDTLWRLGLAGSIFFLYTALSAGLTWLLQLRPRTRGVLQTPRGFWLRGARALVAMVVVFPYAFTSLNAHRSKVPDGIDPTSGYGLPFEHVGFKSDDIPIAGWFIPAAPRKAAIGVAAPKQNITVILCHGVGANMGTILGVVPFLHRAGFNVLMFDFRGHGDSGGHTVTFGRDEARDIVAAESYLRGRGFSRLSLYAFSMGGAASLHAAPLLTNVQSIVTDSAFIDFPSLVAKQFANFPPFLRGLALATTDLWTRAEVGASLEDISTRPAIGKISPRALLIIHGADDSLIPVSQAHEIFAAAGQPKELYIIPGADHCQGHAIQTRPYERRVAAFLGRGAQLGRNKSPGTGS